MSGKDLFLYVWYPIKYLRTMSSYLIVIVIINIQQNVNKLHILTIFILVFCFAYLTLSKGAFIFSTTFEDFILNNHSYFKIILKKEDNSSWLRVKHEIIHSAFKCTVILSFVLGLIFKYVW